MTETAVRILLVEDEPGVAETVVDLIEMLGYQVKLTDSGERALELLQGEGPFDLLISDVVMPGISGIELATAARRDRPGLSVILTSGFSAASLEKSRQNLSEFVFLHKPYSLSDLSRSIQACIADGGGEAHG
ncbi:response regulator [Limibacillus halophilus]